MLQEVRDFSSNPPIPKKEPRAGFEPATTGCFGSINPYKAGALTSELPGPLFDMTRGRHYFPRARVNKV